MMTHAKAIAPPNDFIMVSATTVGSDTVLASISGVGAGPVRGLLIGTAGYLNVIMQNGQTRTGVPFQAGINPGLFKTVLTSTSGTPAQNVWVIV